MQCRGTSYLRRLRILDFELTDERAVRKSISGGGLCENECKQCLVKTISTPQCSQRIFRAQSLVPCKYQKDSVFVHGYSQEYFGVWILVGAGHRRSGRSKQRCSRRYPFGLATRELRVQPLGLRHHTPFIMQPAAETLLSDLQIPLANTIQFVAALRFNFFSIQHGSFGRRRVVQLICLPRYSIAPLSTLAQQRASTPMHADAADRHSLPAQKGG